MFKNTDILFLQTGGTIDKIYPKEVGAYGFEIGSPAVENILTKINPSFQYGIETVCCKDSQDIDHDDRENLLRAVVDADQQLILITHGTDTMCETAHFLVKAGVGQGLSYGPGVGEKIVVITGAFQPECMKSSDAEFNVGFAAGVLQSLSSPGVFIAMNGALLDGSHAARSQDGKFVDDRHMLNRF